MGAGMSWLWLILIVAVFGAFSGGASGSYRRDDREYPEPEYDYDRGDCCDE